MKTIKQQSIESSSWITRNNLWHISDSRLISSIVIMIIAAPGLLGLSILVHRPTAGERYVNIGLYFESSRLSFGRVGNPDLIRWIHDRSINLPDDHTQVFDTIQIPY